MGWWVIVHRDDLLVYVVVMRAEELIPKLSGGNDI